MMYLLYIRQIIDMQYNSLPGPGTTGGFNAAGLLYNENFGVVSIPRCVELGLIQYFGPGLQSPLCTSLRWPKLKAGLRLSRGSLVVMPIVPGRAYFAGPGPDGRRSNSSIFFFVSYLPMCSRYPRYYVSVLRVVFLLNNFTALFPLLGTTMTSQLIRMICTRSNGPFS